MLQMQSEMKKGTRNFDDYIGDPEVEKMLSEIAVALDEGFIRERDSFQSFKLKMAKKYSLKDIPSNSMVIAYLKSKGPDIDPDTMRILLKKPSRTLSGVAVVAVMTSPHDCPHGRCIFCPGGTSKEVPTPQSYTGREPAAMRAAMNDYDPFKQTLNRISQLDAIGHPTDKIDLILMGGTLTAREDGYQRDFVKGCLDAMNGIVTPSIIEAQLLNETSLHRCIGMTFETRPDHFQWPQCRNVLELGGTRVELGVQSAFDMVLEECSRGHGTTESMEATRVAKDAGLKVSYHLMPGLPGSTREMDIESAERVFSDPSFRPDMIKIYPTLVVEGTELFDMWKRGDYEPLSTMEAADIVARIKRITPPWVRIQRVQRDIPTPIIAAGVDMSNLRQVAKEIMKERGWSCRCVRCREIGHRTRDGLEAPLMNEFELTRREYDASGGKEFFISLEHGPSDSILGYIRLRDPSPLAEGEGSGDLLFVRELKVFGQLVPIGERKENTWQHRGTGKRFLLEAEKIAKDELDKSRIVVTSGIGVRDYYRSLGYRKSGFYMEKKID